jgi:hypothetical protein
LIEVAARQIEEPGPPSRLIELLDRGEIDEAISLTVTMAAQAASFVDLKTLTTTWPAAKVADHVKRWWVHQFRIKRGEEQAQAIERIWSGAVAKAKSEALAARAPALLAAAEIRAKEIAKALDPPALEAPAATLAKAAPKADFAKNLEPEIAERVEPRAAEPGARIMLPAVIPPSPPLQQSPNWDDVIAVMNKQHAIIENVGGKTVIASWEPSPTDLRRLMVVFQTKESFLLRYSNRFISVEVPNARGGSHSLTTPLGQWWLGHRDRLQFRGVTFRPGDPKIVNECLNLWQGWGVEAKPGDWGLIREHIEKVLAGGNEEFAEYLIRWIAWSVQNPAAPAEVALVLIGEKGAGKGMLVPTIADE